VTPLYPQKLALTSPTGTGRSVGIVRSRTKATDFSLVELKLATFLQLIGTIKRTIFRKVRTETILKLYNTLFLLTFLYGSENWTLTASQRRRIEAAEMKLLRPLVGYALYDYKTNDSIRREL
jgi:hypothetical protein